MEHKRTREIKLHRFDKTESYQQSKSIYSSAVESTIERI